LTAFASSPANIWQFDLVRNVKTRITFHNGVENFPLWSPDGRTMIFSTYAGRGALVLKDLTTGAEQELLPFSQGRAQGATSWSADGQRILYQTAGLKTGTDIWWMSLNDRKRYPYLVTPFSEGGARFSPDGRWVAYHSDESGTLQIYIAPFPSTGAKWQVSTSGGVVPRWRADGKELFYYVQSPARSIVAVPISLGTTPEIGKSVPLFQIAPGGSNSSFYDVTSDGRRLLINTRIGEEPPPAPLILMQHFDNELRAAEEHRQ